MLLHNVPCISTSMIEIITWKGIEWHGMVADWHEWHGAQRYTTYGHACEADAYAACAEFFLRRGIP